MHNILHPIVKLCCTLRRVIVILATDSICRNKLRAAGAKFLAIFSWKPPIKSNSRRIWYISPGSNQDYYMSLFRAADFLPPAGQFFYRPAEIIGGGGAPGRNHVWLCLKMPARRFGGFFLIFSRGKSCWYSLNTEAHIKIWRKIQNC